MSSFWSYGIWDSWGKNEDWPEQSCDGLPSNLEFTDGLPSDGRANLPYVVDFQGDSTPDLGNRQETSNHKGVHRKKRNKKWAARLCFDGRKLELGEYNTQYAASRAYQVGAFYYNKPLDTTSQSFVGSLPSIPDNLSDIEKQRWVRERAREYALTFDGSPASKSVLCGSSSLEARPSTPDSYGAQASKSELGGSSSLEARPTTPDSYGAQVSKSELGRSSSLEARPTTPNSYGAQASKSELGGSSSLEARPTTPNSYGAHACSGTENSPTTSGSASELFRAPKEAIRFKRRKCFQTTSPDVELQQERNQTAHQALPHITNTTDSILFALCELRKQGWNYRLAPLSPSFV